MSLILDGTNGLSDVDGSAATPAIRGTDANTGIFFPAADTIGFAEGGAEIARFDSSGRLGINTTAPNTLLYVRQATATGASTTGTNQCTIENNGAVGVSLITPTANQATIRHSTALDQTSSSITFDGTGRYMTFNTVNGAERMRLDNGGNLHIGRTSGLGAGARVNIESANGEADVLSMRYTNANAGLYWRFAIDSNSRCYFINASDTGVYIDNGGTSWGAYSDERIKDIIEPISNAVEKVSSLRAVIGKYKTDEQNKRRAFLIAQDVQKVLPEAVTEADDELKTLGLQYTEVIPLLVASIKELNAKVEALEAKLA
jgi:hypothetical protein